MNKTEVKQLQRALRENTGLVITIDGDFGKQSQTAFDIFKKNTGVTDPEAMALLKKYIEQRYVTDTAFAAAAQLLGVKESYVRAISEVESAGESFLKDGRVKILFERHWFYKKLKEALASASVRWAVAKKLNMPENTPGNLLLAAMVNGYPNICNPERGGYKGNEAEWDRFNFAMDIHAESACQATSYGGYQIMGFNHKSCGYATAKDMMLALASSESKQLLALVAFVKANPSMHKALKEANWAKFAECYNGSAYKENKYDTKLAAAEEKHGKAMLA
jgi:hypothetical protein